MCSSGVRACRFAYRLLTPITAGPAQVMLGLAAQGVVGMSVKNPAHPGAPGVGLGAGERARFPPALAERAFGGLSGGYSWAPASVNGGALLDFAGAEVLLVGGDAGPPPPGGERAGGRGGAPGRHGWHTGAGCSAERGPRPPHQPPVPPPTHPSSLSPPRTA